jgi:hypothetical protein
MSTSLLFLGLLFGSLGAGYCVYGRRQRALIPFLSGLLLIAIPYFIASVAALLVVGVVLAALPFFVKV